MKTTIKSIRMEKFEGQFTGKLIISITDDILAFVRNVDTDGVITFKQDNAKVIRMQLSALSAQCRAAVNTKLVTAFGYRLDAAKETSVDEMCNVLNVILSGATIDVEANVQQADEANDQAHDAIFYKISKLNLNEMSQYLVAHYFIEMFMKVHDVTRQQTMIAKLFGIAL